MKRNMGVFLAGVLTLVGISAGILHFSTNTPPPGGVQAAPSIPGVIVPPPPGVWRPKPVAKVAPAPALPTGVPSMPGPPQKPSVSPPDMVPPAPPDAPPVAPQAPVSAPPSITVPPVPVPLPVSTSPLIPPIVQLPGVLGP